MLWLLLCICTKTPISQIVVSKYSTFIDKQSCPQDAHEETIEFYQAWGLSIVGYVALKSCVHAMKS